MSSTVSRRPWGTTSPPLRWIEIAVTAGAEAVEAVSEILDRVGYGGIAVEEPLPPSGGTDHIVKAYLIHDHAARARVRRVREAVGRLRAFGLGPVGAVRLRRVADEDWLERWKESVRPVRVGAFVVRPTWSSAQDDGGAIPLVLDPGMAFGTGLHPTTRQCLEALSTLHLAGARVLDVGTGSGILAIAAARRGAAAVVAVDTDELAVRAAAENAARNAVAVEVRPGSAADLRGEFDVVVANIVGPVLGAIARDLRARTRAGGTLLVAGIIRDAEVETVGSLVRAGFAVLDRDERSDWVCLSLR